MWAPAAAHGRVDGRVDAGAAPSPAGSWLTGPFQACSCIPCVRHRRLIWVSTLSGLRFGPRRPPLGAATLASREDAIRATQVRCSR